MESRAVVRPAEERDTAKETPPAGGHRRLTGLLAGLLGAILAVWLAIMVVTVLSSGGPNGKAFGGDFAMFYSASRLLAQHGNPYDPARLYAAERATLSSQGVAVPDPRYVGVGNPPLLFWALGPLARLPFRPATSVWIVLMLALSGLGFAATVRALGWRRWALPAAVFLATPQVVLGLYYGTVDGLVFAGLAAGLLLATTRPRLAGVALTLTLLKPPVALPLALIIVLFHAPRRRDLIAGFLGSVAIVGAATAFLTGPASLGWWLETLTGYAGRRNTLGDVAPLGGLYAHWLPAIPRTILELTTVCAACLVTALALRRTRGAPVRVETVAWLWFVWFLAAPFGHLHDEILLTIPVVALLRANAAHAVEPPKIAATALLAVSVVFVYWTPLHVQLLGLTLVGALLLLMTGTSRRPAVASRAVGAAAARPGSAVS
jgi:hypothetical protein